jgi:hypothetical protein
LADRPGLIVRRAPQVVAAQEVAHLVGQSDA